ncbi:MFS transporter [Streptacidiphilus monticola]
MSGLQIRAVIVAIALVVLDGYDVSLTSFAAPYIEKGFGVSKAELGLVMSGALIGMLVGSIIVAPLADRIGRRKMGVASTITIAVGMLIGPFASPESGTGPWSSAASSPASASAPWCPSSASCSPSTPASACTGW